MSQDAESVTVGSVTVRVLLEARIPENYWFGFVRLGSTAEICDLRQTRKNIKWKDAERCGRNISPASFIGRFWTFFVSLSWSRLTSLSLSFGRFFGDSRVIKPLLGSLGAAPTEGRTRRPPTCWKSFFLRAATPRSAECEQVFGVDKCR